LVSTTVLIRKIAKCSLNCIRALLQPDAGLIVRDVNMVYSALIGSVAAQTEPIRDHVLAIVEAVRSRPQQEGTSFKNSD
jgi:hypothetical protein